MNRTGAQLAAIDRRLNQLVLHPPALRDEKVTRVLADCRHQFNLLRRKFQATVALELNELPEDCVLHARLSRWLQDESIPLVDSPRKQDADFTTLDGFLLAEDVTLLDQWVVQVAKSVYNLDTPEATSTEFLSPLAPAAAGDAPVRFT